MQWHMPIGYKVINGTITVYEENRKLVERIFQEYDNGESALKIAQKLKAEECKNAQGKVAWTHTSIGRILENRHYLGTEYYPQIIDKELFERVQERREQYRIERGRGKHRPDKNARILFGGVLVCSECGGVYSHIQPHNKVRDSARPAKWKCKNYEYHKDTACAGGSLTDEQVKEMCVRAINSIIHNKGLIRQKECGIANPGAVYWKLERMLEQKRTKERTETTDSDIMTLLYERAAERYKTLEIRDTGYRTKQMEEILDGKEELTEFDEELYLKLIEQIVVYKDSSVKVIFRNGSNIKIGQADTAVRKGEINGRSNSKEKNIHDSCPSTV